MSELEKNVLTPLSLFLHTLFTKGEDLVSLSKGEVLRAFMQVYERGR